MNTGTENFQAQESPQNLSKIKANKTPPKHIIVKLLGKKRRQS
jgi:hypothetical protein